MLESAPPLTLTPPASQTGEFAEPSEVTLLDLVNLILSNRWRFVRWMLVVGVLAVIPALFQKPTYTSSGSFVLQNGDQGRSGLAGLAGQLGVQLPAGGAGQTPQFYGDLLHTRELLTRVVLDSVSAPDGNRRVPVMSLFPLSGTTPAMRRDEAIKMLSQSLMEVSVSKTTGVVTVAVTTQWPSVSRELVQKLLDGVNFTSLSMRQAQATAERRFSEVRLNASRDSLRNAENRLAAFVQANRQYQVSSDLTFARERLQREVNLQQQVYTSLVQSYEDARLRELRDTPAIMIVDTPADASSPNPRGRVRRFFVGAIGGAALCLLVLLISHLMGRGQRPRTPAREAFRTLVADTRRDLTRWLPRRASRKA